MDADKLIADLRSIVAGEMPVNGVTAEKGHLHAYAAKAAAEVLIESWDAALRDGADLGDLLVDINVTRSLLGELGELLREHAADISAPAAALR